MRQAAIKAISSYLPEAVLTNRQLAAEMGDWTEAKIWEKTGIQERHIAAEDECASDLAVLAARRMFESCQCSPEDIDFLLFCTQSPDYFLPATACLLQDRLKLPQSCGAIDFNQGCSGFVYGLGLAKSLVETGLARNVLLLTAETYSKFIDPSDRNVRTLFGDGAAATLVSVMESEEQHLGPFVFGTDGRGWKHLMVPGGAARHPHMGTTELPASEAERRLHMNGPEVFNFTIQTVPSIVNQLLQASSLKLGDIDYFVFHQANAFILEHLRKKIGISPEKFCVDMASSGNTVSSTIPLALESCLKKAKIAPGSRVMVVGFGVGYSWAAGIIKVAKHGFAI